MSFDPESFGRAMAEAIQRAIYPLREEIADLRKQLDAAKEHELPDIQGMVDSAVSEAVAEIPAPQDGKSITLDDVKPLVDQEIKRLRTDADEYFKDALAQAERARDELLEARTSLRQPADGKSITLDDVAPLIGAAVDDLRDRAESILKVMEEATEAAQQAVQSATTKAALLRQPEDGKSVTVDDVRPIIEDQIKQAVSAIPTPKDGVGMAGMLIDRDGNLIATMTNGEAKNLGPVVGKDGLSLDSFVMEYDADEHEVVLKASCGSRVQETRYPAGGIRPAGYWREGTKAKSGEAWTHDGHAWFAKRDTSERPDAKSDDWQLAVRRGRDGESVVRRVKDGPAAPIKLGGGDAGND